MTFIPPPQKTIVIACDHAGFDTKQLIINYLGEKKYNVTDLGTHNGEQSVDYPDYAHPLATQISNANFACGILLCGSANGVAITANKHPQVRAAICWTPAIAQLARQHNNANVLCIPARFVTIEQALEITEVFISTAFEGGRHQKRVDKIPIEG